MIRVFDGARRYDRRIRSSDVVVEGQTGGEWVRIGRYRLPEGRKGYVEISNEEADGIASRMPYCSFRPGRRTDPLLQEKPRRI
ncbi:MAG: hypothetical protein ACLUEV_01305 [Alistipes sp.]